MARNDKILLDGIIDDRISRLIPSSRRDEVFEYLAFEQILKDYDLSHEEIEICTVDGRNDGGIDGFFILVNGILLIDPESFVWPRTGSELEVWIITCKHHDTFLQAPLDKLVASLSELFDLRLRSEELKGVYSEQVIKCRDNLRYAYRKLSPRMSKFSIHLAYASRGDTSSLGESVVSRSEQLKSIVEESFGQCESTFGFFGCSEFVELHRKVPNYSLELPFLEILSKGERYVLLANLQDYHRFVTDNGRLRRYLFDSNVRDFMGLNRVNEDIRATLEHNDSPDFWWLNNGVTILATKASVIGKLIKLQDIQIVNGLQTTETIFRYFEAGGNDPNERAILVKVVVSNEDAVRDAIIRATNNQTDVELASLHATDKIQRDIEAILERHGLHYERRKNYYANLGHSPSEIVTPLYLAAGYVNLILKSPHRALQLRSRFMRSKESYEAIFSAEAPITVWPMIALLLKRTDEALERLRPSNSTINERFLKNWRQTTCFVTVSRLIGKFDFSANELTEFDHARYTREEIEVTWKYISSFVPRDSKNRLPRHRDYTMGLCRAVSKEFGVTGIARVEKGEGFSARKSKQTRGRSSIAIDRDFALRLHEFLPPQPWKPGIDREAMKVFGCTRSEYYQAVALLIDEGLRYRQKDGVVYDEDGSVLCFDPERVDADSMMVRNKE